MNNKIINYLNELLSDGSITLTSDPEESIYYHEAIGFIWGEFDCGIRGLDHNGLVSEDISITDLMENGVVVVPENMVYISNEQNPIFENIGFDRLPLESNHIVGY
ncbi:MAG: hypothetical protein H9W82_09005 [Lactobacillus sp.]|nr:hypothetical protein [Lactobacillus sp.]